MPRPAPYPLETLRDRPKCCATAEIRLIQSVQNGPNIGPKVGMITREFGFL